MADRDDSDDLADALAGARPSARDPEAKLMMARAKLALFGKRSAPVQVGRFEIDKRLGAGGMGVVYRATDTGSGRNVALKVVRESEPRRKQRLLREARALARVDHPNVVRVVDAGTDDDGIYIAMELIDGIDMAEWIERTAPTLPQILAVLRAAGTGLSASHAAGVVHGDCKPANILVTRAGGAVVVDFGLARLREGDPVDPDDPWVSRLTAAGAGTPAYMAPEQLRGVAVDERSDQFAFCVTAFEALTGRRPYRAKTAVDLERAISSGAIDRDALMSLPERQRLALVRGLHPKPGERFSSMAGLLAKLDPEAGRWRWAIAISAIILAAAGTAVGFITCN